MEAVFDPGTVEATMLAGLRIVAFLVVAPPFSYRAFPGTVKVMLALGLALAVSAKVAKGYQPLDTGPFVVALVLSLVTGLALGFLVMLVFAAVQSAGSLVDLFGGFSLAQAFDPQMLVNGAQFTRLLPMVSLALLFTSGGYQLIVGGILRSFDAVPVTGVLDAHAPLAAMTDGATQLFLSTIQIAGPLVVVLFLADLGLGLLTRVAPALNAYAMGFPLKILLTLAFAGALIVALPGVVSGLTGHAVDLLMSGR